MCAHTDLPDWLPPRDSNRKDMRGSQVVACLLLCAKINGFVRQRTVVRSIEADNVFSVDASVLQVLHPAERLPRNHEAERPQRDLRSIQLGWNCDDNSETRISSGRHDFNPTIHSDRVEWWQRLRDTSQNFEWEARFRTRDALRNDTTATTFRDARKSFEGTFSTLRCTEKWLNSNDVRRRTKEF